MAKQLIPFNLTMRLNSALLYNVIFNHRAQAMAMCDSFP